MSKKLKICVDLIAIPIVLALMISTAIYGMNYFGDKKKSNPNVHAMMIMYSCTTGDATLGCM